MAESYRKKVTLHVADAPLSMESVLVTPTATMTHGSALKADGTEALAAEAANVVGFIDDIQFGEFNGDNTATVLVNVVKRNAIINEDAIKYSDAAWDAAGTAAVEARGLLVQAAATDFSLKQ